MGKLKSWYGGLSKTGKVAIVSVATLLTLGTIGTLAKPDTSTQQDDIPKVQSAATSAPVITYKEVTETETVPFEKTTQNDLSRDAGTSTVTTLGVNGIRTKTYKVTQTDGKETDRVEVKNEITKQPISEVTSVGTRQPYVAPAQRSNCDPNYSGGCVPIASDVDCGGGSGNGPAYFYGTATVVGADIYDLDRDGDGIACE